MSNDPDDSDLTERDLDVIALLRNDDPCVIEDWIQAGGNILQPFEMQRDTLLHVAAYKGCNRIVASLLGKGVDVNFRDEFGKTPVMGAAQFGRLETVKILMSAGADLTMVDENGSTALHWALALRDRPEVVQFLYGAGANLAAKNLRGLTPHDYARQLNRPLALNYFNSLEI